MPDYILIVTPYHDFGEMLRLGLSESEKYCPYLTHNSDEAILAASQDIFSLAIIDTEMVDRPFRDLWQELIAAQPELQLVLIFPEAEEDYPSLKGMAPLGCVDHLLYMPDFLELIDSAFPLAEKTTEPQAPLPMEAPQVPLQKTEPQQEYNLAWLEDPQIASAHLEKQLPACSAQAAMIARSNQVLAYSDQLEVTTAQEVANRFTRYWNTDGSNSDLVRFIHLGQENQPFLLYASSLVNDVVLTALYQPDTPLSQPHRQISKLARMLLNEAPALPAKGTSSPQMEFIEKDDIFSQRIRMVTGSLPDQGEVIKKEEFDDEEEDQDMADEAFDPDQFHLEELLSKMPSPDPVEPDTVENQQEPELHISQDAVESMRFPWQSDTASLKEKSPNGHDDIDDITEEEFEPLPDFADLETSSDSPLSNGWRNENASQQPAAEDEPSAIAPEETDDKQSDIGTSPLKRPAPRVRLDDENGDEEDDEEFSDCVYTYTTFVTPLLKRHALTRELAQILAKSMNAICKKNNWKLINMTARPSGMLWTARIPASVTTGQMVKIVREETSDFLYEIHPRLKYEALSENFWAPNYLVVSGSEPPEDTSIKEFLHRIHQANRNNGSRH